MGIPTKKISKVLRDETAEWMERHLLKGGLVRGKVVVTNNHHTYRLHHSVSVLYLMPEAQNPTLVELRYTSTDGLTIEITGNMTVRQALEKKIEWAYKNDHLWISKQETVIIKRENGNEHVIYDEEAFNDLLDQLVAELNLYRTSVPEEASRKYQKAMDMVEVLYPFK